MPAEMIPLGGGLEGASPGLATVNTPFEIGLRRGMTIDNANRVNAQISHDRGIYSRPAVGPVEYSEGNIKKSTELTGVAGYNQKQIPLRDSADDMSQQEYIASAFENTPQHRADLQNITLGKNQFFLNTQEVNDNKTVTSHNSPTSLMAQAKIMALKQLKK